MDYHKLVQQEPIITFGIDSNEILQNMLLLNVIKLKLISLYRVYS